MKVFRRETLKVFFFLGLLTLFCQTVFGQKDHCGNPFSFDEILSKFTTRRTISSEPINKELSGEIAKRKIGFELNEANEKTLRDAGANDSLIKLIRENVFQDAIDEKILYAKYFENYDSVKVEKIKIAIEAAKEFIEKFENKECHTELVKYYKEAIPQLIKTIKDITTSKTQYKSSAL